MHLDPVLPTLAAALLVLLLMGLGLRAIRQPYVVAYLLAGVVMGPHGLGLVTDVDVVERLGAFGVMLLLFFVGMEVSPKRLAADWKVPVIGTLLQIALSVGLVALVGARYGWGLGRVVLIGFVISLSSTAVVLKVLAERGELETRVGRNVLGVLLVQDLAVVPMMVVLGLFSGAEMDGIELAVQIAGAIALTVFFVRLVRKDTVRLPLSKWLRGDHEMQVFAGLALLCTLSLLTGLAHLSAALGAFAGGMLIGAARETEWVHQRLEPFRVVFVALFFVSVGMLVDLSFMRQHWLQIALLVLAAMATNTLLNGLIIRGLGEPWRESLYSGLILSQVGEFSFLLAAVGVQAGIIADHAYQLTVAVICVTLLLSPLLIGAGRLLLRLAPRSSAGSTEAP